MSKQEIEFSELLKDHIEKINQQRDDEVFGALEKEAKLRGINKENYQVDFNQQKFIKIEDDEE